MIINYKIPIFILFLFCHLSGFSQSGGKKKCGDTTIYEGNKVDKPAHFKKEFDLIKFFTPNFKYQKYIQQGFEINVVYIVEKSGDITFYNQENSPLYDSVTSVIKKLPEIKPARLKNKKVRSSYYFQVFFCDTNNIIINPLNCCKIPYNNTPSRVPIDEEGNDVSITRLFDSVSSPCPPSNVERFYEGVQQMPEFPGGHDSLNIFIEKNIKYPLEAIENLIQGKVYVSFIVEKHGSFSDIQIISKKKGFGLEEEALRLINIMPKWEPGKLNGEIVRVKFYMPINFKLKEEMFQKN